MDRVTVGNVEMVTLTDGQGDIAAVECFPDCTLQQWKDGYPELLDADDHIHPRYGSVAIRSSGKLIIVDTGMQADDGTLLDDMRRKGVDRGEVDLVMLTHLHPDHVGWNLTDGSPTFPKARYLVPRADWDYWTRPDVLAEAQHVKDQVMPLDEMRIMDLIDGEYRITDELTTLPTPGHTPGHSSIVIVSGGHRGLVLGDVAHSPAQAHHTDWSPAFDVDRDEARRTRHKILDQVEADGSLVASGHFPDPGFGRFVRREGRRVWQGI